MTEKIVVESNRIPEPEGSGVRQVGLLDALLWARGLVLAKRRLWWATGYENVESIIPFIKGWLANTRFNGGYELAWQEFREWLREVKGDPLGEDWCERYLRECQGDHEKATLKFLDLVAEYVEAFGWAPRGMAETRDSAVAAEYGPLPDDWGGRQVRLIDVMLWLRQQLLAGNALSWLTGFNTIESLSSFIYGWLCNAVSNRRANEGWGEFQDWLRDVKKEFPGEDGTSSLLRDCQGDHGKAVMKLLDLVAEYEALQQQGREEGT